MIKRAFNAVYEVIADIWDWLMYSGVGSFIVLFAVLFTIGILIAKALGVLA